MTYNPFYFITDCFSACFPAKRPKRSSPTHRAKYYNARLNEFLPEPISQLPDHRKGARAQSGASQYTIGPSSTAHPRITSQDRFSSTRRNIQWATSYMSATELTELFELVHSSLAHVPYAICGLAALIDHGLTSRPASRISIIFARSYKNNIIGWAKTRGYDVYADSIGVPTRGGLVRRVRMKFIGHGFEALQLVRSSFSHATILSLTSQLDHVAAGWLESKKQGDERALRVIAGDVFFCLDRIAARREVVDPKYLPTFLGAEFFVDFSSRHLEAHAEMTRAGIDVKAVVARHRAATSLREHDEVLQRYGMQGDPATPEPRGQFEDIAMSVYTVRDKDSPPRMTVLPDMPQPPRQAHHRAGDAYYSIHDPVRRKDESTLSSLGRNLTAQRQKKPKPAERPGSNWI